MKRANRRRKSQQRRRRLRFWKSIGKLITRHWGMGTTIPANVKAWLDSHE
jgi:hypothetical protein